MWILLSLSGAFSQALGMAVTKKAVNVPGTRNFIAATSFLIGAAFMLLVYFFERKTIWPDNGLSIAFFHWMFWTMLVNILSVFFLYKALRLAELNYLMPFMTLTSLTIIIPPIILLNEFPSPLGVAGIALVAIGALAMDYRRKKKGLSAEDAEQERNNRLGKLYFIGTALCYTISPATTKMMINESSSLFTTFSLQVMLGLAFVIFMVLFREKKKIKRIFASFSHNQKIKYLIALLVIGLTVVISN
jgi:drug/metabolite transporter (DMT)-like permease